jgi:microsomal epoxide hydrolase
MFHRKQDPSYLAQLTQSALHLPAPDAHLLLSYPVPRSYWREAVYATERPVLYLVGPGLAGQAASLVGHHVNAETAIFPQAGHALFVDEPDRFNRLVLDWLSRRVWPGRS